MSAGKYEYFVLEISVHGSLTRSQRKRERERGGGERGGGRREGERKRELIDDDSRECVNYAQGCKDVSLRTR
jgi:hypothetical protein